MDKNAFSNVKNTGGPLNFKLSARQYDVLAMRAHGLLNKQIAGALGISEYTVKEHVTAALRKMGLRSVEQAIVLLARVGLV